jgi:nitrite reductase (NADH) small subunit
MSPENLQAAATPAGADAAASSGGGLDFRRLGSVAELRAQDRLIATVGDQTVVVFDVGGSLVAIPAECPHAGGPLCQGERAGGVLSCPWHGYNFDLRTGACEDDDALRLERYEVRIEGDDILVKL